MAEVVHYENPHSDPNYNREVPFRAGGVVGRAVTFLATAAIAQTAIGWGAGKAATLLSRTAPKYAANNLSGVISNFLRTKAPQISESAAFRTIRQGESAYQKWQKGFGGRMEALRDVNFLVRTGTSLSGTTLSHPEALINTQIRAAKAFFKPQGLGQRAIGATIAAGKTIFAGTGAAYVAERVLGDGRERPSLWNVPGVALDYGRYVAETAPFALLMGGGARYAFQGAKTAVSVASRAIVKGLGSAPQWERILQRTSDAIGQVYAGTAGIESAVDRLFYRSLGPNPVPRGALDFYRAAFNPETWLKAAGGVKESFLKGYRGRLEAMARPDSDIMMAIARAAQIKDVKSRETFLRQFAYSAGQPGVPSAVEYSFGLKRAVEFDKWLTDPGLARKYFPKQPGQSAAAYRQARGEFYESMKETAGLIRRKKIEAFPGVYQGTSGRYVDLRNLTTHRLRNRMSEVLNREHFPFAFRIPFLGPLVGQDFFHPLRMLLIPDLLQSTRYHEFSRGSVFLGKNPMSKGLTELSKMDPTLAPAMRGGLYDPSDFQGTGIIAGGVYHATKDGKLFQLNDPRSTYKLFAHSRGLMGDTMNWLTGRSTPSKIDERDSLPRKLAFWLDFQSVHDQGVFNTVRTWVGKFIGPRFDREAYRGAHPYQIFNNIEMWTKHGDDEFAHGFVENFHDMTLKNITDLSPLRLQAVAQRGGWLHHNEDIQALFKETKAAFESDGIHPLIKQIGRSWNFDDIIREGHRATDYASMSRLMGMRRGGRRSVRDAFTDFMSLNHLTQNWKGGQLTDNLRRLTQTMLGEHAIDARGAARINALAAGLVVNEEGMLLNRFIRQNQDEITGDSMRKITDFLQRVDVRRDIETTLDVLYAHPLKNAPRSLFQDFMPYDMETHQFRQTPFVAVPWTGARVRKKDLAEMSQLAEKLHTDPVTSGAPMNAAGETLTKGKVLWAATVNRFAQGLGFFGAKLDLQKYQGGGFWSGLGGPGTQLLLSGVLLKRAAPLAAAVTAYQTFDRLADMTNLPLIGQGFTPFVADQLVKARMGMQWLYDNTGVTDASKYLEGLFPGMIDSPLMRAARGVVLPVLLANKMGSVYRSQTQKMIWAPMAGFAVGAAQGFGMFDITKSHEQLKDIYAGREEVPIRKGRWWESSSSPFQGGRITAFVPNWYARLKASYKDTPDAWGSPLEQIMYRPWPLLDINPLGWLLGGGQHYAYRHYYSRPYAQTGVPFQEVPFIGPIVAGTIGRFIQPPKALHTDQLYGNLEKYGFLTPTNSAGSMPMGRMPGTTEYARAFPTSRYAVRQVLGDTLYNMQQMAGFPGFAMQTATETLMGWSNPNEQEDVLSTANEITAFRRQYYDLELGGLIGASEIPRRFFPKKQASVSTANPLQNRMPKWLPIKYRLGDAYAQTPMGELVLPGKGYSAAHDVQMSFPVAAEWLGLEPNELVRRMLSLGRPDPISRHDIETMNVRQKAAAQVYEPFNDVYGAHDELIRKGRRQVLTKMKDLSAQDLGRVLGPQETDISEMNFYLRMAKVAEGELIYRVDGMPVMSFTVRYNEQRFQRDMNNVARARSAAKSLYAKGVGFEGEGYSHTDRVAILASVSPWSNEYKRELDMAKQEVRMGRADKAKLDKAVRQRNAVMMSKEFYPRRFLGKVMSPESHYNSMNLNENIKAAANYNVLERSLGAIWEGWNSINHPLDKFSYYKTPLDAYKAETLYGRSFKSWASPFEHWVDAYSRGFMSKTGPMSGALAGVLGAYAFTPLNGPAAAMFGGGVGAVYGTAHGIMRMATGSNYIPGTIKTHREIHRYFDQLEYAKNMMLYERTGNEDYLEAARGTMSGLNASDMSREAWSRMYRATPYSEKPYIMAFLKETDAAERGKILKVVPEEVAQMLQTKWAKIDGVVMDMHETKRNLEPMPDAEWAGWAPEVSLDDIELKTVQQEGFDAHDFGLGFQDQTRRIRNSPSYPGPINLQDPMNVRGEDKMVVENPFEIKRNLERVLQSLGKRGFITISPSFTDNSLTVTAP